MGTSLTILSSFTYLLLSVVIIFGPSPCTAVDDETVDRPSILPVIMATASVVAALVAATKSIDDSPKDGPVVTGWDCKDLRSKCLRSSPSYDSSVEVFSLFPSLFPTFEWWSNKNMLYEAVKDCASVAGFRVTSNHGHICCNRYGKNVTKRKFIGGSLHKECTMIIHLKAKHDICFPSKMNDDGSHTKSRSREDWKRETCIVLETSKNPKHQSC